MIDEKIKELAKLAKPKYLPNYDSFEPGKDYVFYSGQLWDEKEIELALKSFLTGKWVTAGENCEKFQIRFSKKFNVKQSHMVNSGSSANLVMASALKKYHGWKDGDEVKIGRAHV